VNPIREEDKHGGYKERGRGRESQSNAQMDVPVKVILVNASLDAQTSASVLYYQLRNSHET
jgi:hypothetical protein